MSQDVRSRPDARLILLLGALAACGPISIDMYLPSLPSITQAFSVSVGAAQSTLTSFMLGFSIGMLLYGPMSDAYGRRPVLLGGIIMYTIATIACALSPSIGALITFRFLQALGAGAASVLARAIARDAHGPSDAARVLSMLAIVTSIGPLLAPLIGGQLLLLGGWRVVFIALTIFGAVCAVTAFLRVPETWPREKRAHGAVLQSFAAYGTLLKDPVTWGHMLCGGMAFASMFAYITATPFVYIEYFHVSATGWGGLWSIVAGLFFVVGVVGVLSANCTTDLMHRYPRNAGAAAAVFGAMQLALGALSSFAVGLWHDGSPQGMGVTIAVAGTLCFVGRGLVLRWHSRV
jgi:DHA1 family bicyclomycin/chloramphenicol resistance-like MFS transporter